MPHVPLSTETRRRLDALFDERDRDTAAHLLVTQCGSNLPFDEASDAHSLERIRFAALKLSNSDLGERDLHAHEAWFPPPRQNQ